MRVEIVPIPEDFIQRDYREDPEFRDKFQQWINQTWEAKDALIEEFQTQYRETSSSGEPKQVLP